ncbi:hypothetical protein GCM10008982_32950 [Anoxybacillus voinovskiensis]|nr:hypothetical protein GCM10008982_32950 [Anoxybacillus voinovskiensis]
MTFTFYAAKLCTFILPYTLQRTKIDALDENSLHLYVEKLNQFYIVMVYHI